MIKSEPIKYQALPDDFREYTDEGFNAVLCKGYNPAINPRGEYKTAKESMSKGFTSPAYISPGGDKILDWLNKGGWVGWVIPKGLIVLDVDGKNEAASTAKVSYVKSLLRVRPPTHATNFGVHMFFKSPKTLPAASSQFTKTGLEVTYRCGGKSYLILAPLYGRQWEYKGHMKEAPQLPDMFLPYDRTNKSEILKCLCWSVGEALRAGLLRGYEDLDLAFMAFLMEKELQESQIQEAFKLIFLQDYREARTRSIYDRTKNKLALGEPIIGTGTFLQKIKDLDLPMVLRFLKELEGQFSNKTITVRDFKESSGPTVTDQALLPAIPFPFEILPLKFRAEIELLASAKGVEPEFVASCMLTILSGALGNTVRIMAKKGHAVSPFCWFFVVAESGYGKSPTMNELFKIIREKEAQTSKKFNAEWQEYQRELLKARDEKNSYLPPKPLRAEFFVTDYTVESLADFFENNPRGGISYQDEIAGVIKGLNQYKGKGNDREHHLTLFNNQAWKINRRSGVRFICNTGIAVIGGIQPKKMTETFQADSFDDGLLSRFLIFIAREQNRAYSWQEVESLPFWDSLITAAYSQDLRMDSQGFADPEIFRFEEEAHKCYAAFFDELQRLKPFLSDRGRVFIPKLVGYYTLKFAGLLHFIYTTALSESQILNVVIELPTLKGAIKLTRYFASQAMTTIKLYDPSAPKLNEFQRRLLETLYGLKEEVKNGKLALTRIAEAYNTGLPPQANHSPKMLGTLLRQLRLTTVMSTGGRYFLKWEQAHLYKLFSSNMSTSPTMPTKSVTTRESLVDKTFSKSTKLNYASKNVNGNKKVEIVDFQKSKSPAPSQQHQGEVEKVDQVDVYSNEEPRIINWKDNWQLEES